MNSASTAIVPADAIGQALRSSPDSTPESGPTLIVMRVTWLAPRSAAIACTCSSRDRHTESSCIAVSSGDLDEFDRERQSQAGQRMIRIDGNRVVIDVGDDEVHHLAVGALALQLHADCRCHVFG